MFLITAEKGIRGNGSETPGKFLESHLHIREMPFLKREGTTKRTGSKPPKPFPKLRI